MNVLQVLAQDAYDANQYRGVIGASKESRNAQKELSAEAITRITNLIEAVDTFVSSAQHTEHYNEMAEALERAQEELK